MTIVDEHVAAQRYGGIVIDAACAVRDIAHDNCQRGSEPAALGELASSRLPTGALLDDVRNGARKHLKALWHLQGDHCRIVFPHMKYSFVNFERVVAW